MDISNVHNIEISSAISVCPIFRLIDLATGTDTLSADAKSH